MKSFDNLSDEERELVEQKELELREVFEEKMRESDKVSNHVDSEFEVIEESRNCTFYESVLPKYLEDFEQSEHSRLSAIIEDNSELEKQIAESIKAEKERLIAQFNVGEILPPVTKNELIEDYIKEKLNKADEDDRFFDAAMEELFEDTEE